MRKNIVAGNWKMNLNRNEGIKLVEDVLNLLSSNSTSEVVFSPSFVHLYKVNKMCKSIEGVSSSAQNCSAAEKGAFTGEVSAEMIKSLGVEYVILGHSESRENFTETNKELKQKVDISLKNGLKVIFCCGESLSQRKNEVHFDCIKNQIEESLFHLSETEFENIVIAYEPIWAIGTGVTASTDQAQEIHQFIRCLISEKFNNEISENTSILYGGSCKPSNAKELFSQADIDGGLIGGASLNAQDFAQIINSF